MNIAILVCLGTSNVYAHLSQENKSLAKIQEWKNQQDKIKIQFRYNPAKPLIYTETNVIFSIQDLNTGNHTKGLTANITITENDRIFFNFSDIDIQNGDLSLKVRFVEDGNYQVIISMTLKKWVYSTHF